MDDPKEVIRDTDSPASKMKVQRVAREILELYNEYLLTLGEIGAVEEEVKRIRRENLIRTTGDWPRNRFRKGWF